MLLLNQLLLSMQLQHLLFGTGGLIICLLVALTFKLNKQSHAIVLGEIERLRNGGSKKDVDPKVAKTVKDLTGVDYDKVWPENQ